MTGGRTVKRLVFVATALAIIAVGAAACATGQAYGRARKAAQAGDWDEAVTYYREALRRDPESARYRIELERAMGNASRKHEAIAKDLELKGDLEGASREYRVASDYAPSNRALAGKAADVEQKLRERLEANRPKPKIDQMKDKVRQAGQEPLLNPTSRNPIDLHIFSPVDLRSQILATISKTSGINIIYDKDFQDRNYAIDFSGLTLEQALQQILSANQLFYKVLNERTIIISQDSTQKRAQYEDQVIQTFFISNADVTELQQSLTQLVGQAVGGSTNTIRPVIMANKTANTITVRGSAAIVDIIERIIEANDKPRAEIVVDVEILEVNRSRAKQYGLNLTSYAIGAVFSPEGAPSGSTGAAGGSTTGGTTGGAAGGSVSQGLFNLNTITRGISASDFYLAVPQAVVRFLETDSETKLIAKPQLRGQEGKDLTLNLGDSIPIPSTVYTPIAAGGAGVNPLTSFTYKDVGVNVVLKGPRVTYTGDIIMELSVESSNRGQDVNIAGQNLPSFGTRKVTSTLRLRDGESNLLAGLLREDERKSLQGFPGAIHTPVLKQLFSGNDNSISQTDIVMLLTPHIVRTHEVTEGDLKPIYIGTGANPNLSGAPPLIGQPSTPPAAEAAPPSPPPGAAVAPKPGAAVAPQPGAAVPGMPVTPPAPTAAVGAAKPGVAVPTPGAGQPAPSQPAQPPAGAQTPPQPAVVGAPQPGVQPPAQPSATPPGAAAAGAPVPGPNVAQVLVASPSSEMRVGGGPYTVVISISDASRVSTVSFSLMFNPSLLRVRGVNQGSFMSQGGQQVGFAQQVDSAAGRVDVTLTRTGDTVGASGAGSLAVVLFDAVAAGSVTLNVNGVATAPGGAPITLNVTPATVAVR
jgi:type II secretory pathway component GspD/PulD (secretin)